MTLSKWLRWNHLPEASVSKVKSDNTIISLSSKTSCVKKKSNRRILIRLCPKDVNVIPSKGSQKLDFKHDLETISGQSRSLTQLKGKVINAWGSRFITIAHKQELRQKHTCRLSCSVKDKMKKGSYIRYITRQVISHRRLEISNGPPESHERCISQFKKCGRTVLNEH